MSLSEISDTSFVIFILKHFYKWYAYIEQRMIDVYCNSETHRLAKGFCAKVKIYFRYSFLGRNAEIKQTSSGVLDNSRVVKFLINFYKKCKSKIIHYLRSSLAVGTVKDAETELYFSPVRAISIIVVIATLVNVVLSFVFQKQIGLWGWLLRGLFLFLAVAGLFCRADWPTVKENSLFLEKMRR